MHDYSIGQACKLLGVKPHVLRYWEQEVKMLAPRKSKTGRRIYSDHDLQVMFRLKHLLYDRRFTVEGAIKQIWAELNTANLNLKSRIASIRSELLFALSYLQQQQTVLEAVMRNAVSNPPAL